MEIVLPAVNFAKNFCSGSQDYKKDILLSTHQASLFSDPSPGPFPIPIELHRDKEGVTFFMGFCR